MLALLAMALILAGFFLAAVGCLGFFALILSPPDGSQGVTILSAAVWSLGNFTFGTSLLFLAGKCL